jgi:Tfp pilus assembly protein PilZ
LIHLDLSQPSTLIQTYDQQIRSGGLFVETSQAAELHETVTVYVTLPPPHGILEVQGRVVHKSTSPPGLGLELVDRVVLDAQIGPILATLNR